MENTMVPLTTESVSSFGQGQMQAVASIADKITSVARTGDIDEMGKALAALLSVARQYDPESFAKSGGFLGFFKKKMSDIQGHFATVDTQVDSLVGQVENRIKFFQNRIGDLSTLYGENEKYHEGLVALKEELDKRVDWMEHNVPEPTEDAFSMQKRADWLAAIDYGKKRSDDVNRAMLLSEQQAPQIRQMATNSSSLVQKFSEVRTTTIPVLKNAFALYILNIEQKKGAEFSAKVDDLTNETLRKNSSLLGQNTVAIHKSLARSTVDIDTLKKTQEDLLRSLGDVQRIHMDMQTRLAQERPQLEQLRRDLSKRLMSPNPMRSEQITFDRPPPR